MGLPAPGLSPKFRSGLVCSGKNPMLQNPTGLFSDARANTSPRPDLDVACKDPRTRDARCYYIQSTPSSNFLAASRMVELSRMAALVTLLWTTHANLKLGMASIIITWVAAVGFFVFPRHFVSQVSHRRLHASHDSRAGTPCYIGQKSTVFSIYVIYIIGFLDLCYFFSGGKIHHKIACPNLKLKHETATK